MKTLYAIAYVLLGYKLPIKNSKHRASAFIAFIWLTAYLPQVLGMAGADGDIAEAAFNIPILICDSLSYVIDGVLLGLLYKDLPYHQPSLCLKPALIKTMALSAIIFPVSVLALEQLLGAGFPALYAHNIMQISAEKTNMFYVIFYSCFIITGALLPLFFRMTEYNSGKPASAFRFGIIFAVCLWSPVVIIMIAFGADILPTLVYTGLFAICITAVASINGILMKALNDKHAPIRWQQHKTESG